ncbi:uncharacterized protein [Atheta coriaria]|uniref:uncharacterized protein n=1 Tax=Dalotia coriaria TaxID=877792 RepID=UPI0031F365A5
MSHANFYSSRPGSYYDNYGGDKDNTYDGYEDDKYDQLRNELLGFERTKSPTQTISLLTTVPQNITPANIAGRHAPTRHSLRHSRMIVMNRLNTVPTKTTPPMIRFHKLAKVLVALQFVLGICVCAIAFWIYLFAPNINERDIPYWSGIPLVISGLIGFLLLFCTRRRPKNAFAHSIKILSVFLSTVAGVISLIASVFACIHLMGLLFMACEPQVHLNNTCLCTLSNSTSLPAFIEQQHHYADLQCHELNNFFVFLMIGSCGANLIGALVALWYVYLHWSSRYLYAYTKVQTNAAKESQGTNGTNPH